MRLPLGCCLQVVALVTEGQQRPEIPPADALPGRGFAGYEDYCALMRDCWAQVRWPLHLQPSLKLPC